MTSRIRDTLIANEINIGDGRVNYLSVSDIATRDSLTVSTGDRVRVLSLPYVYEYDGYLASWNIVERGNPALLSALTSGSSAVERFVDGYAGDDELGDGLTPATAWKTHQRAVDELPDGCHGYYLIKTVDTSDQECVLVRNITSPFFLSINIIADLSSPVETITLTGGGSLISNPTDPNGGNFHSVREYPANPWTTSVDEQSHFIHQNTTLNGLDFPALEAPVGTTGGGTTHESDETAGTLLILGRSGSLSGSWELQSYTSKIVKRSAESIIDIQNAQRSNGVTLTYHGFTFSGAGLARLVNVDTTGCRFEMQFSLQGKTRSYAVVVTTQVDNFIFAPRDTRFSGIIPNGAIFVSGPYDNLTQTGLDIDRLGPLLMRGRRTGDGRKLVVGSGAIPQISIFNIGWYDAVGTAATAIQLVNCNARLADQGGGVAVEDTQITCLELQSRSFASVLGTYGETSGVCVVITDGSSASGLGSQATNLTSALGATSQVQVGEGAPTDSFSALPVIDATTLCRAE